MPRNRSPSPQAVGLLSVLLEQPAQWRHGYDLAKAAKLSSGTLYPLLIRLHERGLLEAQWVAAERTGGPARHVYRLSSAGVAQARALQEQAVLRAGAPIAAQPA